MAACSCATAASATALPAAPSSVLRAASSWPSTEASNEARSSVPAAPSNSDGTEPIVRAAATWNDGAFGGAAGGCGDSATAVRYTLKLAPATLRASGSRSISTSLSTTDSRARLLLAWDHASFRWREYGDAGISGAPAATLALLSGSSSSTPSSSSAAAAVSSPRTAASIQTPSGPRAS